MAGMRLGAGIAVAGRDEVTASRMPRTATAARHRGRWTGRSVNDDVVRARRLRIAVPGRSAAADRRERFSDGLPSRRLSTSWRPSVPAPDHDHRLQDSR